MNLQQKFQENWKQHFYKLTTTNTKLLVAVSGGADSIVLADLIFNTGFDFALAHCNFQLRGEESIRDELFVRSLAEKYGKAVHVQSFETAEYAAETKISIQEAARELRYGWFRQLTTGIKHQTYSHILTAHHANDNIETLLMNFFRGTGISGLHGILPQQDTVIRPLLFATKEEIVQYAAEKELNWVEDSSNASNKYTRNYLRNKVIPMLATIYPQAEQNLLQNIERFKEAEAVYDQAIELHKKKLLVPKGNEFHIPVLLLKNAQPLHTIIFELVKGFGFSAHQVNEVKKLADADNGSYIASATHRIIKNRKWLIIAPLQTENAGYIVIEEKDEVTYFPGGKLSFNSIASKDHQLSAINSTAALDADEIKFPLLLRKYKQGDYFYPLGMLKKKKLSRFFIDQKLSATQKENVWVLEMNKKIIWVIGHRIDNRFKVQQSTKNILKIVAGSNQ